MLALKAGLFVGSIGTVLSVFLSLSSGVPLTGPMLFGMAFHAVASFLMLFVISMLPMPGAVLTQRHLPELPVPIAFLVSLLSGMLFVYLLLWALEQPAVETDGATSIYRHAGPFLNATRNLAYYLYPLAVMSISLLSFYLLAWREKRANKTYMDSPARRD